MSTRGVVDDRRSRWRLPLPDARHVPWVYVAGQGGGTLIATTVSSVLPVSAADEQLARDMLARLRAMQLPPGVWWVWQDGRAPVPIRVDRSWIGARLAACHSFRILG